MKREVCIAAASALLMLTACGGGGGPDVAPAAADDNSVPASALDSPRAFSNWVGARQASDDKDPLMTDGVLPPTSDTEEPVDLN